MASRSSPEQCGCQFPACVALLCRPAHHRARYPPAARLVRRRPAPAPQSLLCRKALFSVRRGTNSGAACQPRRKIPSKERLARYCQIKVSVIGRKSQQTSSIPDLVVQTRRKVYYWTTRIRGAWDSEYSQSRGRALTLRGSLFGSAMCPGSRGR